jgi:hypothetical protein
MDIKDFVKTTLLQISEAIDESNDEFGGARKFTLSNMGGDGKWAGAYGMVEFDLAVEAKTSGVRKKDGGLKIAVLEAKVGSETEHTDSSISRIKFFVMDQH